jgi:hypothetical protein
MFFEFGSGTENAWGDGGCGGAHVQEMNGLVWCLA